VRLLDVVVFESMGEYCIARHLFLAATFYVILIIPR
jgi:hypothetical protein